MKRRAERRRGGGRREQRQPWKMAPRVAAWGRPSSAFTKKHPPPPRHRLTLWVAKTPASLTPTAGPPTPLHRAPALYILHPCACLLFFNRRPSLDTRSHDDLFLPLFFFFFLCFALQSCICFFELSLSLVFSFLKLAFWSCFANNRHAFVLFFVLNGVGSDDSAQRSTLGC